MARQVTKNYWPFASLFFLIAGVCSATADQTYGVPTGTLTVTTFEAPLLQTRNTKSYSVSSYASYAPGVKKDPHGAVGINRSFQQRYANNVYGAIIPIPINSKDWPANSGIDKTRTYGPYTPGDYAPVPESYGMETLNLVFIDGNGISHALDTKQILSRFMCTRRARLQCSTWLFHRVPRWPLSTPCHTWEIPPASG